MPSYKVVLTIDAAKIDSVKKKLREAFGASIAAQVEKIGMASSRADRLSNAESSFEDAKSEVESLKEELESWKEGLPENLQNGSKAEELDSAISELESLMDSLESCDFSNVSFPGMY